MSDLGALEGRGRPVPRVDEESVLSLAIKEERVLVKARVEAEGASDCVDFFVRGCPYRDGLDMVDTLL